MSLVAGTFLNVQIKKIYMNFLKWPIYARIPIRLGIMGIPFVAAGSLIAEKADGGMRDALSIFDTMMNISLEKILSYELVCKNLGICGIESYVSLVDLCFKKNLEGAIKLFHEKRAWTCRSAYIQRDGPCCCKR